MFVCIVSDDLHRVLIGTYRTICTETVEFSLEHAFTAHSDFLTNRERRKGNVIYDTQRKVIFGFGQCEIFVNGKYLRRCGIVRSETITSADDERSIFLIVESLFYIEIKRLAIGTGFFCTVEHGDAFCARRDSCHKVFGRERTVQVYGNQTNFFTFRSQIVDRLADSFGNRTHSDDDILSIRSSVIIEKAVFATGNFRDFIHVFLYDGRNSLIVVIARFTVCKESIGILGHTASNGMFRVERTVAEFFQSFLVDQRSEVFILQHFDFLNLMRGTESVEEIDERNTRLDR